MIGTLDALPNEPQQVTRQVTRLARQDEARQVAFGVAHLEHSCAVDPHLRGRPARGR